MTRQRLSSRLFATTLVTALALLASPALPAQAEGTTNLAAGKTVSTSGFVDVYPASNITDGNQATYWESTNNAFPQWVQVDLGAVASVSSLVLKLPPGWGARTQTLAVQSGTTSAALSPLVAAASYAFDPVNANTITINATASIRYLRLIVTANTGWPAGQLSELEVYGATDDDPQEPPTSENLSIGKTITASSTIHTFVAANANDDNVATYWEAGASTYPNTLTVGLGANADLSSVVLKLNPASAWSTRTQTIEVLGRKQDASTYTSLAPARLYTFDPATGNTVTIPVMATVADVQLRITTNSGASGGQIAEFQVFGTQSPNPDLSVIGLAWTPQSPMENQSITVAVTVKNSGTAASAATSVDVILGTTKVGAAAVGALAAGATTTVSVPIGAKDAGTYQLGATVDPANTIIELSDANNSLTSASSLVISPVASSDLIASPVAWTPSNPAARDTVAFTVAVKNQGTVASASGTHGITLAVSDATSGTVVATFTGSYSGTIAPGATTSPVTVGTWTAVNGKYSVKVALATDANELAAKQSNNISTMPLFVGRGANLPYDLYEAEDGTIGGGAAVVGPNRTIGDLAGEASGRKAVTLNSTGSYVEFTTQASTNTLVTRFSIPDAPGGRRDDRVPERLRRR
jgi:hypothetical protein